MLQKPMVPPAAVEGPAAADSSVDIVEKATATLMDGVRGFASLAGDVDSHELRSALLELSAERRKATERLVRAAGDSGIAHPEEADGTVSAAIYRTWLKLESAIAGDQAAVESVLNAERRDIESINNHITMLPPDSEIASALRNAVFVMEAATTRLQDWLRMGPSHE